MFIETKDMLRPKIYVINKRKVYDVDYVSFDDKYYGVTEEDGFCEEYTFNEVSLMVNTGFKDKNGKYVYEGDIVKVKGSWNCIVEYRQKNCEYALKPIDEKWSVSPWYYFGNAINIEVIGNIYENKEFLKNV